MTNFDALVSRVASSSSLRAYDILNQLTDFDPSSLSGNTNYPPYNIIQIDHDNWTIEMAVAGFTKESLSLSVEDDILLVTSGIKEEVKDVKYLKQGIAKRAFKMQFSLPDFSEVTGADLQNGLLMINLKRELPETKKPKVIEIGGSVAQKIPAGPIKRELK